jgi:tetratricopeptide (TPR) repeat protein
LTRAARAGIALAAACFCLSASGSAFAKSKKHKRHERGSHRHQPRQPEAGGADDGKAHLKRANALADKGDCQSAIDEYTKAYELLSDPVVLFNRGECFRRVGDTDPAIDDYREFLEKVPNAPNRAAVEAKIAALETPQSATAKSPPPVAKSPPPPPVAKSPPPVAKAPPPPVASSPPPPPEMQPVAPPPPPPMRAGPPTAPTPTPPLAETSREPAVAVRTVAPPAEAGRTAGTRPWVWVALSVLAVGAGAAGFLVFRPHDQAPPDTALGNYRF